MPHINEEIDFTVVCYLVCIDSVLMVHHKKMNIWLPPGGHIELDEDPDEALFRELEEETGITKSEITIHSLTPLIKFKGNRSKSLLVPTHRNIHEINDTHKHIVDIHYGTVETKKAEPQPSEINECRWFTKKELLSANDVFEDVRWYGVYAIDNFSSR